jgi:hypothetical protein
MLGGVVARHCQPSPRAAVRRESENAARQFFASAGSFGVGRPIFAALVEAFPSRQEQRCKFFDLW